MTRETVVTLYDWEKESLNKGIMVMEDIVEYLSDDYIRTTFPIPQRDFDEVMEFFKQIGDSGYIREEE